MELFYSYLQGLFAGGYVGISIGPLAVWTAMLLMKKQRLAVFAVLLGGTLGDTAVAVFFLFLGTVISEAIPQLHYFEHPLVQGVLLVAVGTYMFFHQHTEISGTWRSVGIVGGFVGAFWYNAINPDTFVAMPILLGIGGIGTPMENVARLAGFAPASFATFWLTVEAFALFGEKLGMKLISDVMRILSLPCVFLGLWRIAQAFL